MAEHNAPLEPAEKLALELRRGSLVLATLSRLHSAKYGYALIEELSNRGLEVEQGTLYPLLRRLDEQGLLESSWNVEGARPRKYYQLNATGKTVLEGLTKQWEDLVDVVNGLLHDSIPEDKEGEQDGSG